MTYGDQIAYETMLRLQLELSKFSVESRLGLEMSVFTKLRQLCDEWLDATRDALENRVKE